MKNPLFSTLLAASFLVLPGCDRTSDAGADRADGDHATHPAGDEESLLREIAELEARERELQQQIEAERLAAERDRLEQDRESLDRERRELEARRDAGEVAPPAPDATPRTPPGDGARPSPGRVRVPVSSRGGATGDYRTFYDQLEPHGDWFETPDYGYVYQPQVARRDDWRPYTEGRWVQSQQGWTWASDEPFGWATYHSGRWAPTRRHGWVWIPGDEWAPAWVTWRHSDDHVGWAPLPPETLYHEEIVYDSGFDSRYGIAPDYYTFVPVSRFDQPVARHYLPPARNVTLIDITINITNIIVRPDHVHVGGLDPAWFHRRTGRHFPRYHLERRDDRRDRRRDADFHGDTLTCYAPPVEAPWNERVRPLHVADRWQDVELKRSPGGVAPEARQRFRKVRREREARAAEAVQQGAGRLVMEQQNVAIALQDRRGRLETRREEPAAADTVAIPETPAPAEIAGTGDSDTPAATIPTPAAEADRPRAEEAAAGEAERRVDRVRREPGERRERLRQRRESPRRGQAPPEPEAPKPATPAETAPASQPEPDAPDPARSPAAAETPEAPEAAPTDARGEPAGRRAGQLEQRRQALRQRQQELRQRQLERGRAPAAGRRPRQPGAPQAPQAPAEAAPAKPEAFAPTPEAPADPRRRAIRERREALQQRVAERQEQDRPAAKRRKQPPAPQAGEQRQRQQAEENATQPDEQPPREPQAPRPNERQARQQEAADQTRQQAGKQRQQKEAPQRAREERKRQQKEASQRAREERQRQQEEAAQRAREERQRQQEEAAERAGQEQERQREPAPPEAD